MQEEFEKIIEKLEEYKNDNLIEHDSELANHCKQDCRYDNDCGLCVWDKAIEIVKQVATEYNNGWIPCSERLPEEMELVLIYAESTARGGSIRVVAQLDNGFWLHRHQVKHWDLLECQYNVIAWQPLPLPYTKGE